MLNNIQLISFITDASSSNEAVHLQQRLKSLSTELLTLRNRLHVGPTAAGGGVNTIVNSVNSNTIGNGNSNNNTIHSSTTTVNNTTSSSVIPITNSNKLNNKVRVQFRQITTLKLCYELQFGSLLPILDFIYFYNYFEAFSPINTSMRGECSRHFEPCLTRAIYT